MLSKATWVLEYKLSKSQLSEQAITNYIIKKHVSYHPCLNPCDPFENHILRPINLQRQFRRTIVQNPLQPRSCIFLAFPLSPHNLHFPFPKDFEKHTHEFNLRHLHSGTKAGSARPGEKCTFGRFAKRIFSRSFGWVKPTRRFKIQRIGTPN